MFFVDIDYNKRPQKLKLLLAKPNKTIISSIHEKSNDNISMKLGNIHELNFSIPHYIQDEDTFEIVKNEHVDLIKEKMLIKALIGTQEEWFIVDEIVEDGNDYDIFNVKAFSLGYELSHKRIGILEEESISCNDLLEILLNETAWSINSVDASITSLIRSFNASGTNALDCIIQAGETFGALIEWDTINRKISFNKIDLGMFKGLSVDYGRLMKSISRTRKTDELVTRLYVYGNEDLSIHSVNPSGMPYIEDFSFYMYPFSRDENKKVIKSSDFMSDELCNAILDHQDLVDEIAPEINTLINQRATKDTSLITEQTALTQYKLEMENILSRLDVAKALEDTSLIAQIESERTTKQTQINSQTTIVNNLETEIENLTTQISDLQDSILTDSSFTPQLLDELKLYIIEREWRDDRYIDAQELFDDALEKFIELREPKVVLNIDIANLLEMIEEQYYWDKLVLGDLIKVKYPQMNIEYMAKIVEMNYNFDSGDISITIANTTKTSDYMEQLKEILYKSQSASTLLTNNKHKWDKVGFVEDEVYKFLNSEWDANKNKITAGVNNKIEIGNRGIIIKNPDTPNDVVIIQSGIIALSKDGGLNWKTAIKPDGVIAERLVGNAIIGRNLVLTNENNLFTFDNEGVKIKSDNLIIESADSSTSTFKTIIQQQSDKISLVVSDTNTVKGDVIVASINLQPNTIKINAKNIDISGAVSFSSLDPTMQVKINNSDSTATTVNGWKVAGKTTIDGANIETGTISAQKIKTDELIVGVNIAMGANATISWNNVANKPTIPQTAGDIGALPSTYIDANGVWTGYLDASRITAGSISASRISAGTMTSDLTMSAWLKFSGGSGIYESSAGNLMLTGSSINFESGTTINFNNNAVTGLNLTAKFG